MLYAGGAKFILLSALLYAPGTILFIIAKREQGKTVFTPVEWLIFGVVVVAAIVGLYSLATGAISDLAVNGVPRRCPRIPSAGGGGATVAADRPRPCRAAARMALSPGACWTACSRSPWLTIEAISGTSAGAMNAAVMADGHAEGGNPRAREALEASGARSPQAARFSPLQRSLARRAARPLVARSFARLRRLRHDGARCLRPMT